MKVEYCLNKTNKTVGEHSGWARYECSQDTFSCKHLIKLKTESHGLHKWKDYHDVTTHKEQKLSMLHEIITCTQLKRSLLYR